MPFIPHTKKDIELMLEEINVSSLEALFDEIPMELRFQGSLDVLPKLSEMEITRLMQKRSRQDHVELNFIGAGAYEHHIPACVWDIASRGEFMTAYTPYQAEASQGTLQLLFEYQSMIASLMGLEVSNASMYDGSSALAEAVLMAVRSQKKKSARRILVASTLHPYYRQVVKSIIETQNIEMLEIPFCKEQGIILPEKLEQYLQQPYSALVVPQPNFFGQLESVDAWVKSAHRQGAILIGVVNPMGMSWLKSPGEWGDSGADIVCGEGQPLGVPLSSGGPYFGFLACKKEYIRQLPGRLVGKTTDAHGQVGFTLTLQAREQHIRRSKATSNICTNQGLLVIAATIYMSLMGPLGLKCVAQTCHQQTQYLRKRVSNLDGVKVKFNMPFFHETVLEFNKPVMDIQEKLARQGIQAGYDLTKHYPELGNCLLSCVTETKTNDDIDQFVEELKLCL